jgi:hypothetical protein
MLATLCQASSSKLVGFFPRSQKEVFEELLTRSKSTAFATAPRTSGLGREIQLNCRHSSWRSIRRPCALGLIGLAIAVVLWGLGYKLSLYHQHPNPAPLTAVAKLWTGPRGLSVPVVSVSGTRSHLIPGLSAIPSQNHWLPWRSHAAFTPPMHSCGVESPGSLIQPRSPPAQRLHLA